MKVIVTPVQHYQDKMTPAELQEHLKMKNRGASKTKSKKECTHVKENIRN